MLQTVTFQGLPGQQRMPGALDFPGSALKVRSVSEAESEASMSEGSSEDLVPLPEAAQERDEKTSKKKKPKGLANMFSIFTKGRKKKKKAQSSSSERKPEAKPAGPLPTGRLGPRGPGSRVGAGGAAHWSSSGRAA